MFTHRRLSAENTHSKLVILPHYLSKTAKQHRKYYDVSLKIFLLFLFYIVDFTLVDSKSSSISFEGGGVISDTTIMHIDEKMKEGSNS